MIDKKILGIDCVSVREKLLNEGELHLDETLISSINYTIDGAQKLLENGTKLFFDIPQLHRDVCHAEIDSQKLDTKLNVWTAPFGELTHQIRIVVHFWRESDRTRLVHLQFKIGFVRVRYDYIS